MVTNINVYCLGTHIKIFFLMIKKILIIVAKLEVEIITSKKLKRNIIINKYDY